MAFKIAWYIPERVLYLHASETLTIEMMVEANRIISQHLDAGTPMVHIISDVRQLRSFPLSITRIKSVVTFFDHPALGWAVAVTANPILRFLGTALPQLSKQTRYGAVTSLADARLFLMQRDATLDWSKADATVFEQDRAAR